MIYRFGLFEFDPAAGELRKQGRVGPTVVAVSIFDNETGDLAFDRLATTAADIMVERLTALGT